LKIKSGFTNVVAKMGTLQQQKIANQNCRLDSSEKFLAAQIKTWKIHLSLHFSAL